MIFNPNKFDKNKNQSSFVKCCLIIQKGKQSERLSLQMQKRQGLPLNWQIHTSILI